MGQTLQLVYTDINNFRAVLALVVLLFVTEHIFLLSSDVNRLGSTNGPSFPKAENAPVSPPTSGHLMAEKMRLGRQDQGDNDTGETVISFNVLFKHWG